jgi:glycosyltransferase involved in cell wall biosynthesis
MYSQNLAAELTKIGHDISTVSGNGMHHLLEIMRMTPKADLCYILSSSPKILLPSFAAARLFGKKFAVRIAGDFLWERAVESERTRLGLAAYYTEYKRTRKESLVFSLLKYILGNSDLLIFNSEFQKNLYEQNYGISRGRVIENPYPCPQAAGVKSFPPPPLVVMYAGRLLKLKNLATLIHGFDKFKAGTRPDALLKIFGEGPEENRLKELATELGLQDAVEFAGPVGHENLLAQLAKCWLAVLPSYSDISPNFVFECCAQGTPVVVSEKNYLPEGMKAKLHVFDPRNIEALAGAMRDFSVPQKWEDYQKTIAGLDTSWDFSDVAQAHSNFFESL